MDKEGKGHKDDYSGHALNSRSESGYSNTQEDACKIAPQNGKSGEPEGFSGSSSGSEIEQQKIIDAAFEGEEHVLMSLAKYSSGPIPDVDSLHKYTDEEKALILDWHNREIKALFDDESAR